MSSSIFAGTDVLNGDRSADSQWVYYTASLQGTTQPVLWKVSINGGVPIQITNRQTRNAEPSPDGKYIAAFYFRESSDDNNALSLLDAQTGEVKRITTVRDAKFQWRPNFPLPSVVFPRDEVSNIESFSFEKNISTKVSSFTTGQITDFAYSADGKQIAMIRGSVSNSVVIITSENRQ